MAFLLKNKCLFISWLQPPPTVILELKQMKYDTVSTFLPSICHVVMQPDAMLFAFLMLTFKPVFSLSSFTFMKRLLSFSSLSAIQFSSVQSLSCVQLFATPWTAARQPSLSIINSWSLLKLMSIESVTPSNHLILCRPLLLLPSIFPSIRVFSRELILHQVGKVLELQLQLQRQSFQ